MTKGLSDDRGGINLVKLFVVSAVVLTGYFAWVYVPLYIDHYSIRQGVRLGCNSAYRNRSEEHVRKIILNAFEETNIQNEEVGADGSIVRRPMDYSSALFTVDISDARPPSITVDLAYEQHIVLPLIKKPKTLVWTFTHTEDLSTIKY